MVRAQLSGPVSPASPLPALTVSRQPDFNFETETENCIFVSDLGKPSFKKKSVTFLHSGLTPPYFPESVTKIQKNKAFKVQY